MYNLFQRAREPISSYTHAIGACLSFLGVFAMIIYSASSSEFTPVPLIGAVVFGFSLVALYSASAVYHFVNTTASRLARLRKLDHAMIYVLIAGTYTPLTMSFMDQPHGYILTAAIWTAAIVGIIVKLLWFNAPRWLSTSFYLILGWAIVFDFKALQSIPFPCLTFVAAGGILYSIGAVIYIIKKPDISKAWGFHELFHLFILLGSLSHFLAVFLFAL